LRRPSDGDVATYALSHVGLRDRDDVARPRRRAGSVGLDRVAAGPGPNDDRFPPGPPALFRRPQPVAASSSRLAGGREADFEMHSLTTLF
jgi:hypothetical protein